MNATTRFLLLAALACCLFAAAGCGGPKPHPLSELHAQPATFKLTASTNVLMNYGGKLEEQPVNRNVVPAREAISVMAAKGYEYVPNGPARYSIHADMVCYDPQAAATAHEQNQALDMMEPVGRDMFATSLDRAVIQETWYQYPRQQGPDMCVGKLHLVVTVDTGMEEKEVFQGGVYTPDQPHENDCAYNICEKALSSKLEAVLQRLFQSHDPETRD